MKFGIGAKPKNVVEKVTGFVGIDIDPKYPKLRENCAFWEAIASIEIPFDFKDITSNAYWNWSGKRDGENIK